jgi:Ni/Co efflux regulator RcnB
MKRILLGAIAAATFAAPLAMAPAAAQDNRDWRTYRNYDYNQPPGSDYYADHYYRDGRYYQERRLSRNDRVYRGSNGRYYCRRSDGTTGLIVGGAIGALLGNSLSNGRSGTFDTLVGAGAGAALGSSIDRGSVRCR